MTTSKWYSLYGIEVTIYQDFSKWITINGQEMSNIWADFDSVDFDSLSVSKKFIFLNKIQDVMNEIEQQSR